MVYEGLSKNIVSSFKQSVLVWGRRDSWESLTKRHWNDSSCFPTWFNQNISTTISRYQQTCGFKWWYYDTFWIPLLFNLAMVHLRWIVDDGTNTWQEDYHRVTNQHVWSCRNGRYLFAYTLYKHTSQNCWVADISRAWSIGLWAYGSGPWSIKPFNNHGDLSMVTLNIHEISMVHQAIEYPSPTRGVHASVTEEAPHDVMSPRMASPKKAEPCRASLCSGARS